MSQQTSAGAATNGTNASAKKVGTELSTLVTESKFNTLIDPTWVILQLQQKGIKYEPISQQGAYGRHYMLEDIKAFLAAGYKSQGIEVTEDEATIKELNAIFESAIVRTNPQAAIYSGALPQERVMQIMQNSGMGMGMGFGAQFGMGMGMPGMGMGMPGMGMGGAQFGMGMPGMGMPGMGMGFGQQQAPTSPFAKKDPNAKPQQAQQGGFSPFGAPQQFGMGMGMGMPGMGMGMGMPGMGMGFGSI